MIGYKIEVQRNGTEVISTIHVRPICMDGVWETEDSTLRRARALAGWYKDHDFQVLGQYMILTEFPNLLYLKD